MNKASLIPAYVLHSRLFRETSLLVEVFTREQGRVSLIAKGVRGRSGERGRLLQPFLPLLLSWQGRAQQKLLTHVEAAYIPLFLSGQALACGFYLNELLMRVLLHQDEHSALYEAYDSALNELRETQLLGPVLRQFEFSLLRELGYGISFDQDDHQRSIDPALWYSFDAEKGFSAIAQPAHAQLPFCFLGAILQAIGRNDYAQSSVRADAKRLAQLALSPHLGSKPLASRELLMVS